MTALLPTRLEVRCAVGKRGTFQSGGGAVEYCCLAIANERVDTEKRTRAIVASNMAQRCLRPVALAKGCFMRRSVAKWTNGVQCRGPGSIDDYPERASR